MSSSLPVPVLSIQGLVHSFGRRALVEGLSFDLNRGEILAFVGPNGIGKTTVLRLISGILPLRRDGGRVLYLGQDLFELSSRERAQRVVYLSAEVRTEFPLTAFELVQLGRTASRISLAGALSAEDRQKIKVAMERSGCWEYRDRDYQTLSGGERQLVCLARALAQEAQVLLLDESFSKLDLNHQTRVGELMSELCSEGYAIILVSHDLNFLFEYATSGLIWAPGASAIQGPIDQVVTDEQLRRLYPGARAYMGKNPKTGSPKVFFDR